MRNLINEIATAAVLTIAAVIGAVVFATAVRAVVVHHDAASVSTGTSVSSYNDGWSTSKQDDCQQGFKPACEALATK